VGHNIALLEKYIGYGGKGGGANMGLIIALLGNLASSVCVTPRRTSLA